MAPKELFRACCESQTAAWEEFFRRYHQLIAIAVLRTAHSFGETSTAVIDELVQDVYLKLVADCSRVLREFEPIHVGSDFGYLKTLAANLVRDHFKKKSTRQRTLEAENDPPLMSASPKGGADEMERSVLLKQIDAVLNDVAAPGTRERDRLVFWLYYRHGWSAREIAESGLAAPLKTEGIETLLSRLKSAIREKIWNPDREDSPKGT